LLIAFSRSCLAASFISSGVGVFSPQAGEREGRNSDSENEREFFHTNKYTLFSHCCQIIFLCCLFSNAAILTGNIGNLPYYGLGNVNNLNSGSVPIWGPSSATAASMITALSNACVALSGSWTVPVNTFTVGGSRYVSGTCTYTPAQGETNPSSTFCFLSEQNALNKLNERRNNCLEYSGASFAGTVERYNDAGQQAVGGYWYCVTNAYCGFC